MLSDLLDLVQHSQKSLSSSMDFVQETEQLKLGVMVCHIFR